MKSKFWYLLECAVAYVVIRIAVMVVWQGVPEIEARSLLMLVMQGIAFAMIFSTLSQGSSFITNGLLFGFYLGAAVWSFQGIPAEYFIWHEVLIDFVVSLLTFGCAGGLFGVLRHRFLKRERRKGIFPIRLSVKDGMIGVGTLSSAPDRWFPPTGIVEAYLYLKNFSSWGWGGTEVMLDFRQGEGISETELREFGNGLIRRSLGATGDTI